MPATISSTVDGSGTACTWLSGLTLLTLTTTFSNPSKLTIGYGRKLISAKY